jgi:hypothetical protein
MDLGLGSLTETIEKYMGANAARCFLVFLMIVVAVAGGNLVISTAIIPLYRFYQSNGLAQTAGVAFTYSLTGCIMILAVGSIMSSFAQRRNERASDARLARTIQLAQQAEKIKENAIIFGSYCSEMLAACSLIFDELTTHARSGRPIDEDDMRSLMAVTYEVDRRRMELSKMIEPLLNSSVFDDDAET